MKPNLLDIFQSNQKLSNWFLKLVVCLMMACASISFAQLIQRLTTASNSASNASPLNLWYLPILVFIVSFEVFITRERLQAMEGRQKAVYQIAKWIVFAILLKLFIYLVIGVGHLGSDLQSWQQNFGNFFIEPSVNGQMIDDQAAYTPMLLILFFAWMIVLDLAKEMDILQSELLDYKWEIGKLDNDRQAARRRIAERLFVIGGVMVLVSMMTRLDAAQRALFDTPAIQAPVTNVVLFFLLALVFLSQTQFAFLRGRWFWSQTSISPQIGNNWIRYSLIFFGVVALIALILPTGYTLNLLQLIQTVINFIGQVGLWIVSLFAYLFGLIASLLGNQQSPPPSSTPVPTPLAPAPIVPVGTPIAWLEVLKSVAFWGIFLGIAAYAIVYFIQQNSLIFMGALRLPVIGWLLRGIKTIWAWLTLSGKQISASVAAGLTRIFRSLPRSVTRQMRQFLNFKALTPRQQVIFYYLRLIERSRKSGVDRQQYQTPSQFAASLEQAVPDVRPEVDEFTGEFVEARYSQHPVSKQQTTAAQRLWSVIVKRLHPVKKPN